MNIPTIDYTAPKMDPAWLPLVSLKTGSHQGRSDGLCAMEMVAWLAGEPHSDKPECTCSVLGAYVRGLNDCGPQWVRDEIAKRAALLIGTRGNAAVKKARARVLAECAIDNAEAVLPIFEKRRPNDDRPRKAIQAARDCLAGKITPAEARNAAAYAAAAAAADAAAYAADAAADARTASWHRSLAALDAAIAITVG